MKKRTILLVACVAAAVVLTMLLAWRFWPRSFAQILPVEAKEVDKLQANLTVFSIENGSLKAEDYTLTSLGQTNDYSEIMKMLSATKYRGDFRNVSSKQKDDGWVSQGSDKSMILSFQCGKDQCIRVMFHSQKDISVFAENGSVLRFYHPVKSDVLDKLAEFVIKNAQ